MRFFVQVAFDLENANREDYDKLRVGLSQIHLRKQLRAVDGKTAELPFNTFAGYLEGEEAAEVVARVRSEFRMAETFDFTVGRALITATAAEVSWDLVEFGKPA